MKKIAIILLFLFCVFSSQMLSASNNSNWSKWRGPDNNGISKESNWNPKALDNLDKKWSRQLGYGYSNVSIQNNYVYSMGFKDGNDTVYCLDFDTGKTVWKHSYKATEGSYKGPRATPIYSDGNIYTLSRDGDIFCFNAENGEIIWKKNIVTDFNAGNTKWNFSSSPYIYKNMVILNANKSGIALSKKNGDLIWKSETGIGGYATPVLFSKDSKNFIAMFAKKGLYIINPDTGKEYAFYEWITDYDVNAADPVITDIGIFISSSYGIGCALLDFTGSALKEIWKNKNMQNHFSSSILIDGFLYGISGNTYFGQTKLTCIELKTGKKVWDSEGGIEAVTAAGENFISVSKKGELIISKISSLKHEVISETMVIKDRKSEFWTAPVLCRGFVFCRSGNGELVCINLNK